MWSAGLILNAKTHKALIDVFANQDLNQGELSTRTFCQIQVNTTQKYFGYFETLFYIFVFGLNFFICFTCCKGKFKDHHAQTQTNVQWEFASRGALTYGDRIVVIVDLDTDQHPMVRLFNRNIKKLSRLYLRFVAFDLRIIFGRV